MEEPVWMYIVAIVLILFLTGGITYAIVISLFEGEKRAAGRLGLVLLALVAAGLLVYFFVSSWLIVFNAVFVVLFIGAGIIVTPWKEKEAIFDFDHEGRIDERNIMFSRAELVPSTERFDTYYKTFPDHHLPDQAWRSAPGLLNNQSVFNHSLLFPAADATFYTVSGLHAKTDGPVNQTLTDRSPSELTNFITHWANEMGCHSIGVTELKSRHLYTVGGRAHNYGQSTKNTHQYAIAFTVEMDFARVAASPRSPIILESSNQYLQAGIIAVQLAALLRNLGFSSMAHIDGKYQVRCPQIARDAGLGEIGRMGILMTPRLGPRVRIGVVTTDAPLIRSSRKPDSSIMKFCSICKKCADTCPGKAISRDSQKMINGALQWTINQELCFTYWCKVGTDCGRCIAVCPYSHPDNFLHAIVRVFVRSAPLFRRLAYILDDWLYGRKPPSRSIPDWMNGKN